MLLESDSSWLTLAGPYPMLPRLSAPVSSIDCPCPWFHANPLLLTSLLSSRQLPSSGSPVNCVSRPLPTSGYGEISGPRILCLVSRQNRQRNHLLWQPTHIVLHSLSYNKAYVPEPRFGSKTSSAHQAHIALSGPMTFPSPRPHYNRPLGHWPCVKSCLVGVRDRFWVICWLSLTAAVTRSRLPVVGVGEA